MKEDGTIRVEGVTKYYGQDMVLNNVSLTAPGGSVSCIVGPSGAGKSTLLRCINHLEDVNGGQIWLDDILMGYREERGKLIELRHKEIARQRRLVGMVFQEFNLFPHMTALGNVVEGPVHAKNITKTEAHAIGIDLLDKVGMREFADRYPSSLSGGQKQRVAIARALAMNPRAILFDEPTSALDPDLVGEVVAVMRDLARTGITMIVVSHEMAFVRDLADQIIYMENGVALENMSPVEGAEAVGSKTWSYMSRITL